MAGTGALTWPLVAYTNRCSQRGRSHAQNIHHHRNYRYLLHRRRLRLLNRVVTNLYDEVLRPLGVKLSEGNVLAVTARLGVARPGDVCDILEIVTSTLSRTVDRMVEMLRQEAKPRSDETVLRAMAGVADGRDPPARRSTGRACGTGRSRSAPSCGGSRRSGGASAAGASTAALRECRSPAEKERHAVRARRSGRRSRSLVYAAHLGEPDGPALRGEDPARRHEFLPDPWALPSEVSGPGVPWHVQGLAARPRDGARAALAPPARRPTRCPSARP